MYGAESEQAARIGGAIFRDPFVNFRRISDHVRADVVDDSRALDFRIVEAALRRDDLGFLGLIGSQTKRARFRNRYAQRGIPAATLDRMTCPIGVPGIDGKEPDVIAVAVVAQLLQLRLPAPAPTGAARDAGVMNLHHAAPAHEPRYVL